MSQTDVSLDKLIHDMVKHIAHLGEEVYHLQESQIQLRNQMTRLAHFVDSDIVNEKQVPLSKREYVQLHDHIPQKTKEILEKHGFNIRED